jgi:hypothetical protein
LDIAWPFALEKIHDGGPISGTASSKNSGRDAKRFSNREVAAKRQTVYPDELVEGNPLPRP